MNRLLLITAALSCLLWAGMVRAESATLEGMITRGPLSPVERPGAPNAGPVAGARLEITTPNGSKVASVESNSAGKYSVPLAPGTYLVTVISPAGAFNRPNPPASVVIKAGETTHFDIRIDTGIR
jgi:hypothetical protein